MILLGLTAVALFINIPVWTALPPETVYGIPLENVQNTSAMSCFTNASICQQFVRDHQWKKTGLLMQSDYSAKTNQWDLRGYRPVFYCTNCGVLRIEVKP